MVCLLNEEIRVIQVSMSHIKKAIPLCDNNGEKLRLENKYKELGDILEKKLSQCGDFKG